MNFTHAQLSQSRVTWCASFMVRTGLGYFWQHLSGCGMKAMLTLFVGTYQQLARRDICHILPCRLNINLFILLRWNAKSAKLIDEDVDVGVLWSYMLNVVGENHQSWMGDIYSAICQGGNQMRAIVVTSDKWEMIHHSLLITLLLGYKAANALVKQSCYTWTKMYRLYGINYTFWIHL